MTSKSRRMGKMNPARLELHSRRLVKLLMTPERSNVKSAHHRQARRRKLEGNGCRDNMLLLACW